MTTERGSGNAGTATIVVSPQEITDARDAAVLAKQQAEAAKTAAETAETNAETAETNAGTSETNAASSASAASTSASNAATSASNASTSETNAASSASAASTSASNAATSASNAATSETNAAASAATIPSPTASGFGQIIVQNDADTAYQFLGQGTSGQGLVSKGANALPVYEDAPYIVAMYFFGAPDVSSDIFIFTCEQAIEFPDDFAGSVGHVLTNPSSATVIDIEKNGTKIGQASISTSGVFTYTTTASAVETFAVGDRLHIVTPANLNGLEGLSMTLQGNETN